MKKLFLSFLAFVACTGTQINASLPPLLQPLSSNPTFIAGIYNSSTFPVWITDNNGNQYGSTANGKWICTKAANTLYIWTHPSYNGACLQLTLLGQYTNTPGNCAILAIPTDFSMPTGSTGIQQYPVLLYPGRATNSIQINYNPQKANAQTLSDILTATVTT